MKKKKIRAYTAINIAASEFKQSLTPTLYKVAKKDLHFLLFLWNKKSTGLQAICSSIVLPMAKKIEFVTTLLTSAPILPQSKTFFMRLISRNETKYVTQICSSYSEKISTLIPGVLTVASDYGVKLLKQSSYVRNAIQSQLQPGQAAVINIKLDPSIIGGFTLRVASAVLDKSLKPRLDDLYRYYSNHFSQVMARDKDEFLKVPLLVPFAPKDRFSYPEVPKIAYTPSISK